LHTSRFTFAESQFGHRQLLCCVKQRGNMREMIEQIKVLMGPSVEKEREPTI